MNCCWSAGDSSYFCPVSVAASVQNYLYPATAAPAWCGTVCCAVLDPILPNDSYAHSTQVQNGLLERCRCCLCLNVGPHSAAEGCFFDQFEFEFEFEFQS